MENKPQDFESKYEHIKDIEKTKYAKISLVKSR